MKTEEFILQELEKDRIRAEGGPAVPPTPSSNPKSKIKFMIAGEAPVVVARACELLIKELTLRAWQHTERNRRRTLQRQDVHAAVGESDVYDFLIDIVPRVTAAPPRPDAGVMHQQAQPPMDPTTTAQLMGQQLGGNELFDYQQQQQQQQQQQYYLQTMQQQQPQAETAEQQGHLSQHHAGHDMSFATGQV